ncbi:MAG: SLBB domain-containing protein [Prevotella sp.]|nr:SLBB domain-containing protein [Candidatus Prevotella equi]
MKKLLLFALFCIISSTTILAQSSMTDDQIMQFIVKEHNAGTSQAKIVTKLMEKGVDIQQIRRVRDKYQKQIKNQGTGAIADAAVSNAESIMRKNNGKKKEDYVTKTNIDAAENEQELVDTENTLSTPRETFSEALYNGRQVFGRNIFNNQELTFEPAMNIATPQNYTVGPGDAVKVDIYGASQKSNTYTVSPDGDITIEGYGPINIAGLSISAAQARLRSTLGSRYSSSNIKMSLGQTRAISVNVMGEVKTPGTFTLSAFATVFHALYMAGGVSEIGTLRNIKVYRAGRLVTVVDVYDYILNGKLKGNIRLNDNDVIVVGPFDSMVDISGKVKRPMYYEMKKSESVQSLLQYAGGFQSDAYKKSVRIIRNSGSKRAVFNINEFDMSSFKVADGDVVTVDSILNRYENMVEIKGAVFRPGMYQLGNELTTVRALLEHAEGVTEDAFTNRGVMHRMNPDRTLKVISVDVAGILAGTAADIPLQNEDILFIPTKSEQQTDRTITIHGEVNYPGVYQYADNETLEDFVLQAGGLKETASTVKVDVSRRIYNAQATSSDSIIAKTFSFALKDGFVIDGEQGFVLEPYDQVYVRRSPGYVSQQNVAIEGEVNFPGNYTLTKRETRLSDIVKAAGGTNMQAYIKGARLERRINDEERIRMQQILKMAKTDSEGSDSIDINKLDIGDKYYVGIYLDKALKNPGSDNDLVLREGDRIIVPEYNNTVKISGDVLYPNTVAYKKGENAKYYINQAGGFGNRAKKSHTYIVHMNGTVNQMGKGMKPTPGCEIIVPSKPKADPAKTTQWLAIGNSAAALATTIATIANLTKK